MFHVFGLDHFRKQVCGDCGVCRTFTSFTKVTDTAIQAAEEDGSSDEEVPAERDDSGSESDDDGAERDDSSSESDDDKGEPSNVHFKRNRNDREKSAAAREIINRNDLGLAPFVPGPRTLARV